MVDTQDKRVLLDGRRNWLVTGGCGFIGSALLERLAGEGGRLRVVDDLSVGVKGALPEGTWLRLDPEQAGADWGGWELIVADIRDAHAALAVTRGADVIVHLAASTGIQPSVDAPRRDFEVNVLGTLNYLEGARVNGVKRFVFASSGAPLGEAEPPLREDTAPRPLSPYGASKLSGEGYCSAYNRSFGLETVALRFGNVFGPGSGHKQSVVARFIRRALAGETLEVYGDGQQTRDFIYIDDLLELITRSATWPGIGGELFQIATSRERTVNEVGDAIKRLVEGQTGRSVTMRHVDSLPFEVRRNYSDTSKARRLLGFEARTSFEDGVSRTLDYFLSGSASAAGNSGEKPAQS